MATLYDIDQAILACIDLETGELIDPERLEALQMERSQKIENVTLWIKNLQADAIAFKAEKNAFAEREKAASKKVEQLEKWLVGALDGQKFATARCAVSFRRSETVEVDDIKHIPAELLRIKTSYEPDKTAIKAFLKGGKEIVGCRLVEKLNPQIK